MYSISMAISDYIPVVLFLIGCIILTKYFHNKINKINLVLFVVGFSMVFVAGLLKASYKLIYALSNGGLDLVVLSNQFFQNQSIGFMIAGIGLVTTFLSKKKAYSFLPTMALVGMQVVGLGLLDFSLATCCFKKKDKKGIILFVISFFMELCMGYLATKKFDNSLLNWVAQLINTIGQLLFLLGAKRLSRAK